MIRVMDSKRPGTKMIYQFNLDNCIPKDHLLRVIDSEVDLSFVRDLVRGFYSEMVRARFGMGTFEQFFAEIVRKCRDKGLMDGDRVVSRRDAPQGQRVAEVHRQARAVRRTEADAEGSSPGGGSRKVKTNEAVVSRTDPDASLVARRGMGPMLAHKIHIAVADGKARIVTAVTTTPGAVHEHEEVERLLQKHRFITHEKPQELVADSAYGVRNQAHSAKT
jgi:hypothetical protein